MVGGGSGLELLVHVLRSAPLHVQVSLHLSSRAGEAAWVPRLLEPLGAFLTVRVRSTSGSLVLETSVPKFKPKLRPDSDASYLALDPGYTYGIVLELDVPDVTPGAYQVQVQYTNLMYRGTADRPVGTLALTAEREFVLEP